MANTSRRTKPLPPGWSKTRKRILRRDRCICGVCRGPGADEVDHIVPASLGGTDDEANLQAIHSRPCHAHKTALEANAQNWKVQSKKREPERHPGLIG